MSSSQTFGTSLGTRFRLRHELGLHVVPSESPKTLNAVLDSLQTGLAGIMVAAKSLRQLCKPVSASAKLSSGRFVVPQPRQIQRTPPSNTGIVALHNAGLCLDCNMISTTRGSCTACGSSAVLSVARALDSPAYRRRYLGTYGDTELFWSKPSPTLGDFLHCT